MKQYPIKKCRWTEMILQKNQDLLDLTTINYDIYTFTRVVITSTYLQFCQSGDILNKSPVFKILDIN